MTSSFPEDQLITVGIPTRNRAGMLRRLLEQFRDLWPTVRVLVSDNQSVDDTAGAVASFKDTLDVEYFRQPHGLTSQEHCAAILNLCRTKYFIFFCDDDLIAPAFVKAGRELVRVMESSAGPVGLAFSEFQILNVSREESEAADLASGVDLLKLGYTGKRVQRFEAGDFIARFCENGRGAGLPGMIVNLEAVRAEDISFPVNGGNRCDRLFGLLVNRCLPVLQNADPIYFRVEHSANDVFTATFENHLLFLQETNRMFSEDERTRTAIAAIRLKQWLREASSSSAGIRRREFCALWRKGRPGFRGFRNSLEFFGKRFVKFLLGRQS